MQVILPAGLEGSSVTAGISGLCTRTASLVDQEITRSPNFDKMPKPEAEMETSLSDKAVIHRRNAKQSPLGHF